MNSGSRAEEAISSVGEEVHKENIEGEESERWMGKKNKSETEGIIV